MKYFMFEVDSIGRFAVEAPDYETAIQEMIGYGLVSADTKDDYEFIGESTLEELDAEGLDVI